MCLTRKNSDNRSANTFVDEGRFAYRPYLDAQGQQRQARRSDGQGKSRYRNYRTDHGHGCSNRNGIQSMNDTASDVRPMYLITK
jgi:hypothetical protein